MKTTCSAIKNERFQWTRVLKWIELVKLPISLMNAVVAVAGYVLCRPMADSRLMLTAASVTALAAGSAVLNNYQDRGTDRLFPRTRRRALVLRSISSRAALAFCGVLMLTGFAGLFFSSPSAAGLGVLAVLCYNGLYTPMKIKTMWAILPGVICGMLPALIGWVAGGGQWLSPRIFTLMALVGLWQLPHFWLVLLSDSVAYRTVALPNMLNFFSVGQLHRLMFVWLFAFVSLTLFLPVIEIVANAWLGGALILCMLAVVWLGSEFLRHPAALRRPYSFYFNGLNSAMGIVLVVIILDRLL